MAAAAATFTLVFAYISDVTPPSDRAAAYGSALATLGLSFTVGPPLGAPRTIVICATDTIHVGGT